jgi:hypothetical protein
MVGKFGVAEFPVPKDIGPGATTAPGGGATGLKGGGTLLGGNALGDNAPPVPNEAGLQTPPCPPATLAGGLAGKK